MRKSRTTTIVPAENRPEICVRAPIESFTAVRAPLAPTEKPCVKPAARFATPIDSELLRRAYGLAALPGERARGQDLVGERDEEQAERRRRERYDIADPGRRQRRPRQAARDRADDRDPVAARSSAQERPMVATTTISAPGRRGTKDGR